MKIKELLTDESKWTKGCMAKSKGQLTSHNDPNADCWCLHGALCRCYGQNFDGYEDAEDVVVMQKIKQKLKVPIIGVWNDAPERTFADVRKLIEELDI